MIRSVVGRILGVVFLFSGFVKCADPVGTQVFVEKYLATYSLDSLLFVALPIAILLATVELSLGVMLMVRPQRRITAMLTTLFMALFTLVTLLSATVLPIGDCGCFGDAVKLSPWETLSKNLVMLPMAAYLWWGSERSRMQRNELITTLLALVVGLGLNLYSLRYQPLVEFMPYRVGVNLWEEVSRERLVAQSNTSQYLVFRSSEGEEIIFPASDTECWSRDDIEFVESRTESLSSAPLPFAEFIITNADGEDCTLELLQEHRDARFVAVASIDALRGRRLSAVRRLLSSDADVVVLTSDDAKRVADIVGVVPYNVDAMTLRSLIRSRVGVVEMQDGVIARKCDIRDL